MTLPVSLVAASPQARKHCRRRQAWELAAEGGEMMRGRGDGRRREGILYPENSLVCRCCRPECKGYKECSVFTVHLHIVPPYHVYVLPAVELHVHNIILTCTGLCGRERTFIPHHQVRVSQLHLVGLIAPCNCIEKT